MVAVQFPLPMLDGANGKVFVLREDQEAELSGSKSPEPLVLHINVGHRVRVNLTNETAGLASFQGRMLAVDIRQIELMTPPGETCSYFFYASPELGETTAKTFDRAEPVGTSAWACSEPS